MNPLNFIGLWTAVALAIPGSFQHQPVDEIPNHINTPVRVLLARDLQQFNVSAELHNVFLKAPGQVGWITLKKNNAVRFDHGRFLIGNLILTSDHVVLRGGPVFDDPIGFGLRRYRGALRLYLTPRGIDVVNIVPLDDYLVSTIGAEMHSSWEMEALRAQAVASRSYALYHLQHPRSSQFYDLEGNTNDQAYGGIDSENVRTRQAVSSTSGEFLTQGFAPMEALFHSNCGGETEISSHFWSGKGSAPSVPCPYCRNHPQFWQYRLNFSSLIHLLGVYLPGRHIDITPIEKLPSGRVSRVRLSSDVGTSVTVTGEQLRSRLGYKNLKSTLLNWQVHGDEITFFGKGSGHGVGLCQWGARFFAKTGKNYREILKHYYPLASLSNQRLLSLPASKVAQMWY